jgi:LmbE family N-acetylglucosaminyl deacetylase
MIIPLISEVEWAKRLPSLPTWCPSGSPTVVIAPHPDDETLAVGGLIAALTSAGVDVTVVAVTDGERAYENCEGLGQVRRLEQERALSRLGVRTEDIIRLSLPDSDVGSQERNLAQIFGALLTTDTQLIAPWRGDYHPDHEACGRAAEAASAETGAALISYFFWTWHRGRPSDLSGLQLRRFPLDAARLLAKSEALQEHRSQLEHPSGEPILPDNLLDPARRAFEVIAIQ